MFRSLPNRAAKNTTCQNPTLICRVIVASAPAAPNPPRETSGPISRIFAKPAADGDTTDTEDLPAGATVLGGGLGSSIISASVTPITDIGGTLFLIDIVLFDDKKHQNLLDFYGLPDVQFTGLLNITFEVAAGPVAGDALTSTAINGGIVKNVVPEPGSLFLLGSGLMGFASYARRKLRKS